MADPEGLAFEFEEVNPVALEVDPVVVLELNPDEVLDEDNCDVDK